MRITRRGILMCFLIMLSIAGAALLGGTELEAMLGLYLQTAWIWSTTLVGLAWALLSRIPDLAWLILLAGFAILEAIQRSRRLQAARHAEILAQLREIQDALAPLAAREREKEMMRDARAVVKRHEEAVRRHGHEQALRRPVEGGLDAEGGPHGPTR